MPALYQKICSGVERPRAAMSHSAIRYCNTTRHCRISARQSLWVLRAHGISTPPRQLLAMAECLRRTAGTLLHVPGEGTSCSYRHTSTALRGCRLRQANLRPASRPGWRPAHRIVCEYGRQPEYRWNSSMHCRRRLNVGKDDFLVLQDALRCAAAQRWTNDERVFTKEA